MAVPSCATIQVLEGENTRLREAQVDAESKTARAVQEVADYRDAVRELRSPFAGSDRGSRQLCRRLSSQLRRSLRSKLRSQLSKELCSA